MFNKNLTLCITCIIISVLVQYINSIPFSTPKIGIRRDYQYDMLYDMARPLNEKFEDTMLTEYVFPEPAYEQANLTYMDTIPILPEDTIPYKVLRNKPKVQWKCNPKKLYTIFFTNLESNRTFWMYKQYHHWMVVDIPRCNVDKGEELMPYLRVPGVLDEEYHLYVFYVFEQLDRLNLTLYLAQPYPLKTLRWTVQIAPFVYQHKMMGPVAGTFFFQYN